MASGARPDPRKRERTTAASNRPPSTGALSNSSDTVILFDVMDTIVRDPFYDKMPSYFSLSFEELLRQKHPTAWIDFESARITEDEFFSIFFKDGRRINREDFVQRVLLDHYEVLPGMDDLLQSLRHQGYDLRAFSNYPVWYEYVEQVCGLSKYLDWEFVSCKGVLAAGGHRKPAIESFEVVWAAVQGKQQGAAQSGVSDSDSGSDCDSSRDSNHEARKRVLFVDDRPANVEAAVQVGMEGILFEGAEALRVELRKRGIAC